MDARITIDDREIAVRAGETVLAAARRHGIDIPSPCSSVELSAAGSCRLCIVELDGSQRPIPACHSAATPGMHLRTNTERVRAWRRSILGLYAQHHPAAFRAGDTALARLARSIAPELVLAPPESARVDDRHPYLRFDPAACIVCRRCVRACDEIQGQSVYSVAGRGGDTRLLVGGTDSFTDSACTSCGVCVDHCPTGALYDVDRAAAEPADVSVQTVCGYCGVGCRVEVRVADDRVQRIDGVRAAAVNHGHLCAKGRYAHGWQRSPERLVRPLLRDGALTTEISWERAIALAAERFAAIARRHGPRAVGVLTSSRSTNEAAYLFQKLFRVQLGTNNVDCCARVCHSSTARALRDATGTGAASTSYTDIELARTIVVAGANPTEAHPVVGARIRQAVLRGASLVVIDPRRTELAQIADVHLQLAPGANVVLFQALCKVIVDEVAYDAAYVSERTEGFEALCAELAGIELDCAWVRSGVARDDAVRAARILARAGPALFVTGLGLSELWQGTASVAALCNLALLTGSIGRPGAGVMPLRGQNNVQGAVDMGSAPDTITGYQSITDERTRARAERTWGVAPPSEPGWTLTEMLAAARRGELKAVWIQGEDLAQSDPDQTRVLEALRELEFLVVQELFPTDTTRCAHLVLPACGYLEQDGTFTNAERRIQRVRAAAAPPGEARPDWRVALDLARSLGETRDFASPAEVMDEIAALAPELFGGVAYERLDGDGLQWPCPSREHSGTPIMHVDGFVRGRARFACTRFEPSPEHGVAGFPYVLNTGRVLHHYNVGTMTRRTPQQLLAAEDELEIHPLDAQREGVSDGAWVEVESRWGTTRVRARIADRVSAGTLFLPFHHPESHANRLIGPHVDPVSQCPQYKATAVRLRRVPGPRVH